MTNSAARQLHPHMQRGGACTRILNPTPPQQVWEPNALTPAQVGNGIAGYAGDTYVLTTGVVSQLSQPYRCVLRAAHMCNLSTL